MLIIDLLQFLIYYHIGLRKSKFVMYIFIILNNQPYRNSHATITQMLSTNSDTAVL